MLTKHYRYIKYQPLPAQLYELDKNNIPQYIFTSCYCVVFMDSEKNTVFSIYSRAEPIHFRTIDVEIFKEKNIKNAEMKVLQIGYKNRVFGLVVKPFRISILRQMLKFDMESSIADESSRYHETTIYEILYNIKPNPFVKSKIESEQSLSYQSKLTISNTLQLTIQKNGTEICLWGADQTKMKLIHSFSLFSQEQSMTVSKILAIPNTQLICISFKSSSMVWFYNIDTAKITQLDFAQQFKIQEIIVDFFFSKEMYNQQMTFITPRKMYTFNLNKFFKGQKKLTEIIIQKQENQRLIMLRQHSLSAYAIVLQNIHQKRDYTLKLGKGVGSNGIFMSIPLSKKIVDLDFSAKILAYCYDDGSVEVTVLSSLDSECKYRDPIKLRVSGEDIERFQLKNQKFKKVKISYNRTFVAGAIKNLVVVWRMKELLQNTGIYEISGFGRRVIDLQNWRQDGEYYWVGVQDRNVILSMIG